MIDIHTHILPGLDDGARNFSDSVRMARLAYESGVDKIVCTPHSNMAGTFENYDLAYIRNLLEEFREILKEENIPITLYEGLEIFGTIDAGRLLDRGLLMPLNKSLYCLVEFAFDEDPDYIYEILQQFIMRGYIPIIAHPERYYCIQDYPNILFDWLMSGCRCQGNKGSFLGKYGARAEETSHVILEHQMYSCIASDGHSPSHRTTFLGDIWEYLSKNYSKETALNLLQVNPQKILNNQHISRKGMMPVGEKSWY